MHGRSGSLCERSHMDMQKGESKHIKRRITCRKPKTNKRTKARAHNITRQMDIGGVTDILRGMAYMEVRTVGCMETIALEMINSSDKYRH